MTYQRRLQRWVVVRLLPNLKHIDIARFHKFSDAEGYRQVMQRIAPNGHYEVMFEAHLPEGDAGLH